MELLAGGLIILALLCLFGGPVVGLVALWRTTKLRRRIDGLERALRARPTDEPRRAEQPPAAEPTSPARPITAEVSDSQPATSPGEEAAPPAFNWEAFLGRQGLGWVAVVLLLFGTAFFLRYAFENNWIGPMGQVALGVLVGTGLVVFGWWCRRARGWHIFAEIVTAAGLLLLYLATYAAFGYFTILDQSTGGLFLLLIVVAGALLAVLHNTRAVAMMTVLGGLAVPLLMRSPHDLYQQLFLYLALLNAGVLLVTYCRRWSMVSLGALGGTHAVFWLWYFDNYHPEKLVWSLGFQATLLVLFLAHSLAAHVVPRRRANVFDLVRLGLTAFAWFAAAYVLLRDDYRPWLGSLAVVMAAVYVAWARGTLWRRPDDPRQTLAALGVAVSFIAIALPIQADARWVALGWAAEGAALGWFGLRLRRGGALRGMAGVLLVLAVGRVLLVDTPWGVRDPFLPIFNSYGLPSLGVAACWIGFVLSALRRAGALRAFERTLVRIAGLAGVLLVWVILSTETYGYFDAYAAIDKTDPTRWRWLGHMALSSLWAIYASATLAIGFWKDLASLRWTALALYGLTIGKVLLFDMAGVGELYRIGAFVAVAVVLAMAAWAYQRLIPQLLTSHNSDEGS